MKYINIKTPDGVETIDEFENKTAEQRKELKRCLREYIMAYEGSGMMPYISRKCTKEWREKL